MWGNCGLTEGVWLLEQTRCEETDRIYEGLGLGSGLFSFILFALCDTPKMFPEVQAQRDRHQLSPGLALFFFF